VNLNNITIRNNKEDYSEDELLAIEQAYQELYAKAQGEELTLAETRIIVAYKRIQQEANFKIVAAKIIKPKREKKPKKLLVREKKRLEIILEELSTGTLDEATLEEVDADIYKRYLYYKELENT